MAKQMKNKIRQKIGAVFQSRRRADERTLSVSDVELVDWNLNFCHGENNLSSVIDSNRKQTVIVASSDTEDTKVLNEHMLADEFDAPKQIPYQSKGCILDKKRTTTKTSVKDKRQQQKKCRKDKKTADVKDDAEDLNIMCILPTGSDYLDITDTTPEEHIPLKTEKDIVESVPYDKAKLALLQKPSGKLEKKKRYRKKKSHEVKDKQSPNRICSEGEGYSVKKKCKQKRKHKKTDVGMVVSISEGSYRTDMNEYYQDANNKRILVSQTLLLPNETITSRVSLWISESKFSDASDDEIIQKQKSSRQKKKDKKSKTKHRMRKYSTGEKVTATSENMVDLHIIPSLMECKEEYCIQYKCIPELEINNPKEIIVLSFCNENSSLGKLDIKDNIYGHKKENILEQHKKTIEQIDRNNTKTMSKPRKTNVEIDENTDVYKSDTRDGKKHGHRMSDTILQPRSTGQRHQSLSDKVDKRSETDAFQDSNQQKHATDALLRRLEIFTGIVLEEELKLQVYERKSKQEVGAKFNRMHDNIIKHLLDLHSQFRERLNAIHRTNLEKIDKEIRVCKMVRAGTMSVVEQSQTSRISDNESKVTEKSAVYEEILWRSFRNSRRFDYETVLHPGIESLFCNTDRRDFGVLGQCHLIEQRIGRPVSIIEEEKAFKYPIEIGEQLTYSIRHHLDENVSDITGCAFLDDGCLIMADNNNSCIKLVSNVNSVAQRKLFENNPLDVCVLKTNHVAVTVPVESRVYLLHYLGLETEMEIDSSFETESQCFGISVIDETLIVTCKSTDGTTNVKSFTKDGHLLAFFQNDQHGHPLFKCASKVSASLDKTQLFVSDTGSNSVLGLTLTGCITLRYGHKELREISAICAFDTNSFMVCCQISRNVQVVSNSGEFIQTIIEHDETIRNISINADNRIFITTSRNDIIVSYQLCDNTK